MNSSHETDENRRIVFMAVSFFWVMAFTNVCYFLPVFYERQGYSIEDAGLLISAFYITSLGLRLFAGNLVHVFGFRKTFILAGLISVAAAVGMAVAGTNFLLAFVARALLGVGSSFFQIGLATYQSLAFSEKVRGRAYSLIMAGCLLPMMTLVPLADWLLHRGSEHIYILLPLFASTCALLLTPFLPKLGKPLTADSSRISIRNPFPHLGDCFRLPVFRVALLAFFLFSLADATAAFMSGMTAQYGLMASYFLSSNALVGVSVRVFCARLLDKYPRRLISAPAIVVTAGTLLWASVNPTAHSLIALGLVFGVAMGFGFPLHLALISDGVPEKLQPQAVSLAWFVMGLDFAAVPLLLGLMGKMYGPVLAFRILCYVTLAGACLTGWLWHKVKKSEM